MYLSPFQMSLKSFSNTLPIEYLLSVTTQPQGKTSPFQLTNVSIQGRLQKVIGFLRSFFLRSTKKQNNSWDLTPLPAIYGHPPKQTHTHTPTQRRDAEWHGTNGMKRTAIESSSASSFPRFSWADFDNISKSAFEEACCCGEGSSLSPSIVTARPSQALSNSATLPANAFGRRRSGPRASRFCCCWPQQEESWPLSPTAISCSSYKRASSVLSRKISVSKRCGGCVEEEM